MVFKKPRIHFAKSTCGIGKISRKTHAQVSQWSTEINDFAVDTFETDHLSPTFPGFGFLLTI